MHLVFTMDTNNILYSKILLSLYQSQKISPSSKTAGLNDRMQEKSKTTDQPYAGKTLVNMKSTKLVVNPSARTLKLKVTTMKCTRFQLFTMVQSDHTHFSKVLVCQSQSTLAKYTGASC